MAHPASTSPASTAAPDSLRALRAELRGRGWDSPRRARILAEFALHLTATLAGGALFLLGERPLPMALGVLVCALGSLGIGTNAHTASHGATFRARRWDLAMTLVGYPLLLGFSASYWIHKHIAEHHRGPNVVGVDRDIDLAPVFAILAPQREGARGLARAWYALQWLLVIPGIALNGANMIRAGVVHLAERLRDPRRRQALHWLDLGALLSHLGLWVALGLAFGPAEVLALFGLRLALIGYALFAAFAPAHMPLAAAALAERPQTRDDYLLAVTSSTVNFRTGPLGRLLCSGVEYQIEHHLFPKISHVHYPELAKLVEAYCVAHGYPYRTIGWSRGIVEALRVFREPKPVVELAQLRALRPTPIPTSPR